MSLESICTDHLSIYLNLPRNVLLFQYKNLTFFLLTLVLNILFFYCESDFFWILFSDCMLLEYRSTISFCVLILFLVTLLNSFISSGRCILRLLYVWNHVIHDKNSFISLPIWMAFIYLPCPTTLARTASTVLKRSSENSHLVLFLILGVKCTLYLH